MGTKYAVLICGDLAETGYDEFWNDVVLVREALLNHGFQNNHIYVLYGNGSDYFDAARPNPLYRPSPTITNLAATITNVTAVFNGLANGTGGYPRLTDDDLLFIWTFDHGCGPPCIAGTNAVLCLMDGDMLDTVFGGLVNLIPHAYRVICMQQCHSGGFIDDLSSDRTTILTSCTGTEHAHRADEKETVTGVDYHHGEYNYHLLSALNGQTVAGVAVNADADGNGFVTMKEIFDYIAANENQPETPQYDDGSLNLGKKLYLSFADVYMRDNLQDTGVEPQIGTSLCRSPDINHYRNQLINPLTTLGSTGAWQQDNLFEDVEIGQNNYIYVRLRNRGYSDTPVEVDVYWTVPSTLPAPPSWNLIGTINVANVAQDSIAIGGPMVWPFSQIPSSGHYCFVAILGNTQDPKPDSATITNTADFYNFIRNNNNVVWKNFDVENMFSGDYMQMEFLIQGWPRLALKTDLVFSLSQLPYGTMPELKLLKRLTKGATLVRLAKTMETKLYSHFKLASAKEAAIKGIMLKPSDKSKVTLEIPIPEKTPDGEYEISIMQRIGGKEMGCVTKRIRVGGHPFMADRIKGEIHRVMCKFAKKIEPKNRVAYRDLKLALKHDYNICHYCLSKRDIR